MKPSEKAIKAAFSDVKGWERKACIDSLVRAYAIDVDPVLEGWDRLQKIIAAKDAEIERLRVEIDRLQMLRQRIAELEAEIEAWKLLNQTLEAENAKLKSGQLPKSFIDNFGKETI